MIPAKQSSRTEVNRPWTLKSPLPRYRGDVESPPIARAMAGRARLLVIDTRSPQIASPKSTAITIRPIHFLESAGDDSGTDVFRIATTAWLPSVIVTHPRAMWNEAQDNEETKPSPFPECGRCHCLTVGSGSQNSQAIPPNGRDWFTANNASSNLVETPS